MIEGCKTERCKTEVVDLVVYHEDGDIFVPCLVERMAIDLTDVVDHINDRLVIEQIVQMVDVHVGYGSVGESWIKGFYRSTMDIFTLI